MAKLEDARHILASFDLPEKQQNEISGYTLLALAGIRDNDSWSDAQPVRVSIHDILQFVREEYGRDYAENTRETFQRHIADIAWETEVWIATDPSHMIHFNGERFLPE